MTLRTIALGVCLTFFRLSAQTPASFDRPAWLSDYSTLKATLEKRYSNLAWFASPDGGVDLPGLDRRTLAALNSAKSDDDARSALLSFVRDFQDGHFSQLPALEPPRATPPAKLPDPVYSRQDPAGGCAALGHAPEGHPSFSVPFESLPGFHLVADGLTQPFRAGILTNADNSLRLGIVRIPEFESAYPNLCLEAWNKDNFWNQQGKLVRGALRRAMEQRWYETLAALLNKFKAEAVAAVLVDVGDNSGGDDSGDIGARLFTQTPLHSAPLWMSQDQTASAPYFDEQARALEHALELDPANKEMVEKSLSMIASGKAQLAQSVCAMTWVWRERRPWTGEGCRRLIPAGSAAGPLDYLALDAVPSVIKDARVAAVLHWPAQVTPLWGTWTGPLYVLTDSHTYSAAEMFAAVLQNNHAAKTIGSRTGGDGCGFMTSPEPILLPHSRLRFRIPNCVRMRADGSDEVAGVKPDLPVLPTEGENARARAMRLFVELCADRKQHPQ